MSASARILEERDRLSGWLKEDCGADWEDLLPLCCEGESGRPLYLSHVRLSLECFPTDRFNADCTERLERAYVYLIALYYVIDSLADGHNCHASPLEQPDLAAVIPLLQVFAIKHFVHVAMSCHSEMAVHEKLASYLSENRRALALERRRRSVLFSNWRLEYPHMWGRSNCFIFLLDFVSSVAGRTMHPEFLDAVRRLLAAIQRGDDSSDWREDLRTGSFTPFLRRCFRESAGEVGIERLEEIVYLRGVALAELREVEQEFKCVSAVLLRYEEGVALAGLARQQEMLARQKLQAFDDVRREFIDPQ